MFIVASLDTIVEEWQASGRASGPSLNRSEAAELRACRKGVLLAIAAQMECDGRGASGVDGLPAIRHGRLRQQVGVGIGQLVEEFGALRAAVLTRWFFVGARKDGALVLNQSLRFNQAVDEALSDSAVGFAQAQTAARDAYLSTLAQDLRNPLSAIHVDSAVLARPDFGPETRRNATRRVKAALMQMDGSISDLLEYTRRRSTPGIAVDPSSCDLEHVCEAAVDTVRKIHAARTFHLAISGDLSLSADAPRVQQALTNLLHNAIQYGDAQSVVKLEASADAAGVSLSVWNAGLAIPEASLGAIFEPRVRVLCDASTLSHRLSPSVGLGLFIAREIAIAHGGVITATSHAVSGTRFTIWLPRAQVGPATGLGPAAVGAVRISQAAH